MDLALNEFSENLVQLVRIVANKANDYMLLKEQTHEEPKPHDIENDINSSIEAQETQSEENSTTSGHA